MAYADLGPLSSVIGCACTHTWRQLLACRVLLGLGMGIKASVGEQDSCHFPSGLSDIDLVFDLVPVYAAEVAPAHIRGSMMLHQLVDFPLILQL